MLDLLLVYLHNKLLTMTTRTIPVSNAAYFFIEIFLDLTIFFKKKKTNPPITQKLVYEVSLAY